MSDKELEEKVMRYIGVAIEAFEDALAKLVENIDERIERQITPLQESISKLQTDAVVIKLAIKDTNQDQRTQAEDQRADYKVLNTKLDKLSILLTNSVASTHKDRGLLLQLSERVSRLEQAHA